MSELVSDQDIQGLIYQNKIKYQYFASSTYETTDAAYLFDNNVETHFCSNFLENIHAVSLLDMSIALLLAFMMGMFIFFVYKKTYSGIMYTSSFAITLVALTMITTLVILAITSNIILSLGMVGALSIVRFRTAVKEPMDIAFLFWSIAVGIVLAAGLIPLAVFGSLWIGIILYIFSHKKNTQRPYILVVHCENQNSEKNVYQFIQKQVYAFSLKSKSIKKDCIELNYEIRLKDQETSFVNELSDMEGVLYTVMVSYNGDYMN